MRDGFRVAAYLAIAVAARRRDVELWGAALTLGLPALSWALAPFVFNPRQFCLGDVRAMAAEWLAFFRDDWRAWSVKAHAYAESDGSVTLRRLIDGTAGDVAKLIVAAAVFFPEIWRRQSYLLAFSATPIGDAAVVAAALLIFRPKSWWPGPLTAFVALFVKLALVGNFAELDFRARLAFGLAQRPRVDSLQTAVQRDRSIESPRGRAAAPRQKSAALQRDRSNRLHRGRAAAPRPMFGPLLPGLLHGARGRGLDDPRAVETRPVVRRRARVRGFGGCLPRGGDHDRCHRCLVHPFCRRAAHEDALPWVVREVGSRRRRGPRRRLARRTIRAAAAASTRPNPSRCLPLSSLGLLGYHAGCIEYRRSRPRSGCAPRWTRPSGRPSSCRRTTTSPRCRTRSRRARCSGRGGTGPMRRGWRLCNVSHRRGSAGGGWLGAKGLPIKDRIRRRRPPSRRPPPRAPRAPATPATPRKTW